MSEMTDLVFSEMKENMEKSVKFLEKSFGKLPSDFRYTSAASEPKTFWKALTA